MDMNTAFRLKAETFKPTWVCIDAAGKVIGRLATEIADILRGKNDPRFTPHADVARYVVVINSEKAVFTGDKMTDKEYVWYTGWRSGQKRMAPWEKLQRDHEFVIRSAVRGMLPKNKIARQQIRRLKIYTGPEHPHRGQLA
ncbi:MAG: 50S ribosomal protein L13 [candidate division TM6 bacterium GW2011_GWF2_43_17]|nr:MAG: 50S ribosomal protein L13 [candidate division TM6 bacterium GW2011_GWF2_43_17]